MAASAIMARAFLELGEARGIDRRRLLARAGVAEDQLVDPLASIALTDLEALVLATIDLTGDEALGLHLGVTANESSFDVVAHLAAHAPTPRAAIDACIRFQTLLFDEGPSLRLEDHGDVVILRCMVPETLHPHVRRFFAQLTMAGFRRLVGGAAVRRVTFEHEQPADDSAYRFVFGGRARFGCRETSIALARDALDAPRVLHHASLYAALSAVAERALDERSAAESFGDRLRRELRKEPRASMEDAARMLGTSVRSLRRRLAEEGLSYRDLAQAALEARATEMLRDPRCTAKEVAYALGFADPSAFQRAFKRWRGVTPKGRSAESRPPLRLAEERDPEVAAHVERVGAG